MVVAAGAEERRHRPELRHQSHAEHVAVELDRGRHIREAEVHVARQRPFGQPVERLSCGILELAEKTLDVERQRRHQLGDLSLPLLAWAVGVDLDAVPVGIAQIDRLAHRMVRQPFERDPFPSCVREPTGQAHAVGDEQRDVV